MAIEVILQLRSLIDSAERIVVFTGAGISTESGISDFRSPGGLWSKMTPIDFQDFLTRESARKDSWRRKLDSDKQMRHAQPNRGHRAVAKIIDRTAKASVITQNVDGLHQLSGIDDEQIIELHGNATYAMCLDCSRHFKLEPILRAFEADESLPVCNHCQGIIKTATISFGQPLPSNALNKAQSAAENCQLFLVLGSSLLVYPAAALPAMAKNAGAKLVIVNREQTDFDRLADLVIHAEIGETLGEVMQVA